MRARSTTRSNQRPDTLMQDRSPPDRQNPLATHGRTIHWVRLRRTLYEHMFSALLSNSDIARCSRHVSKVPLPELGHFIDPPQMTTDSLRNLAADRSASLRLRQRRYVDHFIAPIHPRFGLPIVYEATKWQAVDHKVAAGHALE